MTLVASVGSFIIALVVGGAAAVAAGDTYYVAPGGDDSGSGSGADPFGTIQRAAGLVGPGDTVVVRAGKYAGFQIGWDSPQDGTASAPITFTGEPGAVIEGPNPETADGINLEGADHVVVEGFTVDNASGDITRNCIRTVNGDHVVVRDNHVSGCNNVGISTGHSDYIRIEDNTTRFNNLGTGDHHGIYVANATVNPVVVGNVIEGNRGNGLHMNGDLSLGGNGLITGARVEGNVILDNGQNGGSGINCDGVQGSMIRNNLLYDNHSSGISLYRIDAAEGAKDNRVINNTVRMAADGRWALNIKNGSTGNTVSNNILLHDGTYRGAVNILPNSLAGFRSDHNVVADRFSIDDGESVVSLAQWRDATGQDENSLVATPSALFVDGAADDYHLSATSPAVDAGVPLEAPGVDLEGNARPAGTAFDIGAYERGATAPPPDSTPPEISAVGVTKAGRSSVTVAWTTDEPSTSAVDYGRTSSYGKSTATATLLTSHSVTLKKLRRGSTYHFRVESMDAAGNGSISEDLTFKTRR
jgi:Right handed beta helix region/Purple acid Phosphatase, N-terminal domain